MLPNFLIIGAARSGTSYIAKNLRTHPQIYMPRKKELHFFDKSYEKGLDFYEVFFSGFETDMYKAVGEATPAYLNSPKISLLIKKDLPFIKIIVSLRNPVDRAYSHYLKLSTRKENNPFKNKTFEEALEIDNQLLEQSYYYDRLKPYYDLFHHENILVLIFEEFVRNPENGFIQIFSFLNVDTDFTPNFLDVKINSSSMLSGRSANLIRLTRFFFSRIRIAKIARLLTKINSIDQPEMKPETRKLLYNQFYLSNKKLEELVKKDLCLWIT